MQRDDLPRGVADSGTYLGSGGGLLAPPRGISNGFSKPNGSFSPRLVSNNHNGSVPPRPIEKGAVDRHTDRLDDLLLYLSLRGRSIVQVVVVLRRGRGRSGVGVSEIVKKTLVECRLAQCGARKSRPSPRCLNRRLEPGVDTRSSKMARAFALPGGP